MIKTGMISSFIVLLGSIVCVVIFWYFTHIQRKTFRLRTIVALEMFDDAVGRAVEMGRPVLYFAGGDSSLTGQYAAEFMASMACLSYVAQLSARHDADLIVPVGGGKAAEVFPYHQDIVRSAYLAEGKLDQYNDGICRYYERGIDLALMGLYRGEDPPATSFMIGPDPGTNAYVGALSAITGSLVIGGTARTMRIGTTAAYSDYMMISDEVFAAGAILSGDPQLMGMVVTADVLKVGTIIALILTAGLKLFNVEFFINLLRM